MLLAFLFAENVIRASTDVKICAVVTCVGYVPKLKRIFCDWVTTEINSRANAHVIC